MKGKQFLFWLILVAGTLGFLEGAASLVYYLRLPEQERELVELTLDLRHSDANSTLRYVSHPYFNYLSNPDFRFKNGYRPHNSLGLRGPACCGRKKPGLIRIVAIGGSTTYGMYFGSELRVWPALLEDKLRERFGPLIEVINAGVPNYTTYEMIGLMAMRIPEFSPDIVLLHIGLYDAFTVGYPDEGGPDNTHFRHAWSYRPLNDWLKWGMRASHLVRLVAFHWVSQGGSLPGDMAGAIQYPVPSEVEVLRNSRTATGKYFKRNLQTLIALARNMGAMPVLINMPLNPLRERGQGTYYDAVVKAVLRNNQISKEIAEVNGLLNVDLYSQMRDPGSFVDAALVNQAGMQTTAAAIANSITPLIASLEKVRGAHERTPRGISH